MYKRQAQNAADLDAADGGGDVAASEGRGRDGREDGRGMKELRKHQQHPVRDHALVEGALRVMGREKRNNEHSVQKKREGEKGLAGRFALRLLLLGLE